MGLTRLSGLGSAGDKERLFLDNGFDSRNCAAVRSLTLVVHFGGV